MSHPILFKWKHFQSEIIRPDVREYGRYALSYGDLEEMMAERGLAVDHSTRNRRIKRLINPGLGFGSFNTARRTLKRYEAMAMIRKGQIKDIDKDDVTEPISFIHKLFGIAA